MHLTNYAINKQSENFQQNTTVSGENGGFKRSLTFALSYFDAMGHDSQKVMQNVKDMILKTICSV